MTYDTKRPLLRTNISKDVPEEDADVTLARMREKLEKLWKLLDDIDTAGDMFKPEITPFFRYVIEKAEQRHDEMASDGYKLILRK